MIAKVTIREALNKEPLPTEAEMLAKIKAAKFQGGKPLAFLTEDVLTLAAAAGRRAYADLCGDDIVPWHKAKPERQAEWLAVARGMIGSLIKTTPSPRTVDELTRILEGGL